MKKKIIITVIAIILVIAIVTPIYANRNRFPRKLNSAERFEEVFGVAIDPEFVVEEYSYYTTDNDMKYPQTYLCFKLDMTHEELEDVFKELGERAQKNAEDALWYIGDLNELLPENKRIKFEDMVEYGRYWWTDTYDAIPNLFGFSIQQTVCWYSTVENGEEFTYIYTYKYRNYVPDMVG